jgi:hypothetical protein
MVEACLVVGVVNLSVFCFESIGHLLQLADLVVMVSLSTQFFLTAIGL